MNRKSFIESQGGTCNNWTWSWSFVNHKNKFIIFGEWDIHHNKGNMSLILSDEWEFSTKGRKNPAYDQALSHLDLVQTSGYKLKTFLMKYSDELRDENGVGPAKIEEFTPVLVEKKLVQMGGNWFAFDNQLTNYLPEEIHESKRYLEGSKTIISINTYERNPLARKKCIEYYGYKCSVCNFNFEEKYGDIGSKFIHVHHLIPLSTIKKEYQLDPIKDLAPVCPNCHAIIHRVEEPISIEELKEHIAKIHKGQNK